MPAVWLLGRPADTAAGIPGQAVPPRASAFPSTNGPYHQLVPEVPSISDSDSKEAAALVASS